MKTRIKALEDGRIEVRDLDDDTLYHLNRFEPEDAAELVVSRDGKLLVVVREIGAGGDAVQVGAGVVADFWAAAHGEKVWSSARKAAEKGKAP